MILRPPELNQASFWLGQGKINDRWFHSQALRRGPTGAMWTKRQGRDRSWRDARGEKRRREQDRGLRPPTWDRENKGLDRDPCYKDASVMLPN